MQQKLILSMIFLAPLGWLTIRGWVNGFVMVLSLFCLFFLASNKKGSNLNKLDKLFLITCVLPILSALITQALTNNWSFKAFDGPSRFLLGIPIYVYIRCERLDVLRILAIAIPLTLIFNLISTLIDTTATEFWGNRLATYFVDPLTFGNYSLLLGFLSLLFLSYRDNSIDCLGKKIWATLKLSGFLAGLYLSLGSMSRSGWIAIPFLLLFSIWHLRKVLKQHIWYWLIGILSMATIIMLFFNSQDPLVLRIQSIYTETQSWITNKDNHDATSGGTRLSMWVLSYKLFMMNPILGYGDLGYKDLIMTHPNLISSASLEARISMFNGPHNEILANALRYGLFGLIASTGLFAIPAITALIVMHGLKNIAAVLVFCFITGLFICSIALEVFNLKYTSSFYAFLIPTLLAASINFIEKNE